MKSNYNHDGGVALIPMLRAAVLLAILATCSTCTAQICDARSGAPMQMRVQLTIDDQARDTSPGGAVNQNDQIHRGDSAGNERRRDFTEMQIQVQLQDPTGGTFQEQMPSSDGQVRMTVCKKSIYRLRIVGPTIEEAMLDSIQPGRGDSLVTVVLHRKLTKEERKAEKAMVSAHELQIPRKARRQVEKGDAALQDGKLEQAKKHYLRATEIYPQFEEAENKLGVVLMQEGNRTEGKAAFERALAVNSRYAPAQLNLAKIAFDEKRFNDSYLLAKQALSTEPLNPGALFVAAEASFFKGEYGETVGYTRTLHSLPHQPFSLAHFLAAKSLEIQQQPQAAMMEYQTFLQEDPNDPNAKRARELMGLLQASGVAQSQNASPR